MNDIKVSVIVPAYNIELYLRDCLDSLVNQTLEDIEILVVDNNSTDGTKEIIDEYAVKYPSKIIALHQPVQGPSAARNKGLEHAKGKYIAFADSDDTMQKDMYEKMYIEAEKTCSDLVVCNFVNVEIDVNNNEKQWIASRQTNFDAGTNIFRTPNTLNFTNMFSWNKLYRFEVIKKNNLKFDIELFYCEDPLFNCMYTFYAKSISHVKEPLYLYKSRRINSITATFNKNILSQITYCKKVSQFYKDNGYFNLFESALLWVIIGYFRRKLTDAFKTKERKIALEYINGFYSVLEHYYPVKWKVFLRKYDTGGNKKRYIMNFYYAHKSLLFLIVYSPNWLLKMLKYFKTLPYRIITEVKKTVKKNRRNKYFRNIEEKYLYYRQKLPVNDRQIVFSPNSGLSVSGNMYFMLEDAVNRGGYKTYLVTNNPSRDEIIINSIETTAKPVKLVKPNSPELIYALATSKYLATNTRFPNYFIKRPEQVLINTWHGTPLKNLGFDVSNAYSELGGIQTQFMSADYLLFPNKHTKIKMMQCFMLDILFCKKTLLTGYPRNAAFFRKAEADKLRVKLGLADKKVYVYMPTWRGSSWGDSNKKYIQETEAYLQKLDDEINDDTVIFYKFHNYALKDKKGKTNYKHIRPFPNNLDTYMLLNAADSLITDYSSVLFDFVNTGKEIILFTFDAEEYYMTRGMYMSLDDLPFTRFDTIEELISHINKDEPFVKSPEYDAFQNEYCRYDSALAPKYVNDVLLEGKQLEHGESIDYSGNAKNDFHVYFISNIDDEQKKEEILSIIQSDPDALLVIPERKFTEYTNELIKTVYDNGRPCIIARMSTPFTVKENIFYKIYQKTGMFKKTVKNVCLREKERIFPGLSIKRYTNLSSEPLFQAMQRLL